MQRRWECQSMSISQCHSRTNLVGKQEKNSWLKKIMGDKTGFEFDVLVDDDDTDAIIPAERECMYCCPSLLSAICLIGYIPCTFFLPCIYCNTVDVKQELVVMNWGAVHGVIKEPGIYWTNPYGSTFTRISTQYEVVHISKTKVTDVIGNPLMVSGVVTYKISDSVKAVVNVHNTRSYIETQALAVMKNVCSRYPYESHEEGNESSEHEISLKGETAVVRQEMKSVLQGKVTIAGAEIISYEISDLSYAPEIAQAMLVRQQAQATVKARKVIVEGAVGIAEGAVSKLEKTGMKFSDDEKGGLVSSLLITICSEQNISPVISIDSMLS